MATLTRCNAVRVGGLGATLALHVLAIAVVCLPAVLPDRALRDAPPPLQVDAIFPVDAPPPVPLPPPPAPPPRPARPAPAAPVVPQPVSPMATTDRPEVFEPAGPAASDAGTSVPAVDAPATPSSSTAPAVLAEGALAYARVREPVYPADALRRGEQGVVRLRVWVAADGSVERVEIERGSGSSSLDRAARDAVRQWRFRPPLVDGAPRAAVGSVPIVFRLPAQA